MPGASSTPNIANYISQGLNNDGIILSLTLDKMSAFGATPVVQPSTTGTSGGFTAGAGTAVNDQSTFSAGSGTAYRISDIVLALKQLGFLKA